MKQNRRFHPAAVLRHAVHMFALTVLSTSAFAQANATKPAAAAANSANTTIMYKGTDVTAFVEFSKLDVMSVTKPFRLYNWSQNGKNSAYNTIKSSRDIRTLNMVKRSGAGYFPQLGNPHGTENMYGFGLYTSLDPVATRGYGGYEYSYNQTSPTTEPKTWQLIELTTPVGFKFLDLNQVHRYVQSKTDLSTILSTFKCDGLESADGFFQMGAYNKTPECIAFMKFVFQDTLKIDAFSYNYGTSHFLTCDKGLYSTRSADNGRALVITSNTWMNSQNVKVMVSRLTDDTNERRLIQSLFLYTGYAQSAGLTLDPKAAQSKIVTLLTRNPSASIQADTKCSSMSCVMTIYACPQGTKVNDPGVSCDVDTLRLPSLGAAVIHAADLNSSYGLMWPDMEGQPLSTSKEVETWLNQNRLGCDGTEAYQPLTSKAQAKDRNVLKEEFGL